MPRARNIKPGFFKNEELVELPFEYRLLFVGLWTIADRSGRLEDRPKRIKMEVFPADDVDIDRALDSLQDRGFVVRYVANGTPYIQVTNFERHQNPHKNEAPSSIPAPEQHGASTVQAPEQHGATHADSLIPCSLIPEKTHMRSGERKNAPEQTRFEEFWAAYPRKKGNKSKAEATWRKRGLDAMADVILADVAKRTEFEWLDRQYIPYPGTYLNGSHWTTDIEDNRNENRTRTGNGSRATIDEKLRRLREAAGESEPSMGAAYGNARRSVLA